MTRRRILVPVDLYAQSDSALHFARHIAGRLDAMISCIYVIEENSLLDDELLSYEARHKERRDAEHKLSEKVHSILSKEDKTPFEIIITSGKVHQKILEKSHDLNAQTIVMGRSGPRENGKQWIGSNTKIIMAKARVPVIVLDEPAIADRKHIILPLDLFRPISQQATCAVETAKLLDASVSVISVIEAEKSSLRTVYQERLKEIKQFFKDVNIDCDAHLLEKQTSIPEDILSFSSRFETGMILIMDNQGKFISFGKHRKIAEKVIAGSKLPVQCINPLYRSRFSLDDSNPSDHSVYQPGDLIAGPSPS